jgi:RIO-like serine/threonine protein kinase
MEKSSISNGLRFIDDYKVVHIDLNMNNIMVCKDYNTKIIDFA